MMDKVISSYLFPPGYDGENEYKRIRLIFLSAIVWSVQFFSHYYEAYKNLFYDASHMVYYGSNGIGLKDGDLLPNAKIEPFMEILGNSMLFFIPLILSVIISGVMHYMYYTQDSSAILLVRRLPDRHYIGKTCVLGPMVGLGVSLIAMGIVLGLYYWIYITVTPAVCLP